MSNLSNISSLTNTTLVDSSLPESNLTSLGGIIFLTIVIILMTVTIFGNGIVIASWFTYRPIRNPSNLLIVSLAISDFLVGIVCTPLNVVPILLNRWTLGYAGCQTILFSGSVLLFTGSNHLVLIAIDRYMIIYYGVGYLNQRTLQSAAKSIGLVWVMGFLMSCPFLFDPEGTVVYMEVSQGQFLCNYQTGGVLDIYQKLFSFLLPSILMIYFYIQIYIGIKDKLKSEVVHEKVGETCNDLVTINLSQDESNTSDETSNMESKSDLREIKGKLNDHNRVPSSVRKSRRAARILGILVICFCVCFYPFMIVSTLNIIFGFHLDSLYPILFVLTQINSAVNPIIYAIHNKDFRNAFKRMGLPLK